MMTGVLGGGGQTRWALTAPTPTLGAELLTNGDFSAWTGDNPTGWSVASESGSDPEITERDSGQLHAATKTAGGACNFYGSSTAPYIGQAALTVGTFCRAQVVMSARDAGKKYLGCYLAYNSGYAYLTAPGTLTITGRVINAFHQLVPTGPNGVDLTVDSSSVKRLSSFMAGVSTSLEHVTVSGAITIAAYYQAGVWARGNQATDPTTYVMAYACRLQNKVYLIKSIGGTLTEVANAALTYSAGATLALTCSGSSITVTYNGVDVISTTINDVTGTYCGLMRSDATQVSIADGVAEPPVPAYGGGAWYVGA